MNTASSRGESISDLNSKADEYDLMRRADPRAWHSRLEEILAGEKGERFGVWSIWILILYTAARNIWAAASRPFWYDELCTVAVARPGSIAEMWRAFQGAKDSNPPLFCLIEHAARVLAGNELVAYRLPSIAAFCCVLWCLFAVMRKRNGSVVAVVCSASLLLTPLYRPYAVEARPYSMVAACLAVALLCYQRVPRLTWTILMAIFLALAEALHFYAFFGFVPFAVAEAAVLVSRRRFRSGVWLALVSGFVPLALSWSQLKGIKDFYGAHFWSPATLMLTVNAYALFLKMFAPLAVAVVVVLSILALRTMMDEPAESFQEHWLAVAFLLVPVVGFVAIKLAHGGFVERYALPAVLGIPLASAYMLRMFGRRSVVFFAVFILVAVSLQEGFFWTAESGAFGRFVSPADPVVRLVESASARADLPVVVSDGHDYIPLAYYASPDWAKRFVAVVDPEQSIVYSGSDSLDRQMSALRCCFPLQVYNFRDFASQHATFLLYSGGGEWDWWPFRLLHDGYSLQLLAAEKSRRLYLATVKAKPL